MGDRFPNYWRGQVNPAHVPMPKEEQYTRTERQVHTVTDRFSLNNTYLINDEKLVVVDPCSDLNVQLLERYLRQTLHREPREIDLIVLTHLHPDHTAGVESLRRLCHAPVAASAAARMMVLAEAGEHWPPSGIVHFARSAMPGSLAAFNFFTASYQQQCKQVDLWLEDTAALPGHPQWRVLASPGHTPESLCLYNPFTLELLCGDTIVTAEWRAPLLRGGVNRRQLQETLHVLRTLRVHYLYPGHGRAILGEHPLEKVDVE